jgi:hypothetical protein
MSRTISKTRGVLVGAAALAVIAAGACSESRSITSNPAGNLGFGVTLLPPQTTNLPRGTVTFPATTAASATPGTDSIIIISIGGLDSLTTSTYGVFVANDSGTAFRRATGDLIVTRTDTGTNALGDPVISVTRTTRSGVSSWATGGPNYTFSFRAARTGVAGLGNADSTGIVLIATAGATAATPSDSRFLWARRSEGSASRVASMRFGNYASRLADQFVFATNNVMTIIPRGRAEVRGKIFVINDSNYFKPPKGFYYAAYAIKFDTTGRQLLDSSVYLGRKTTPYPDRQSLFSADSTIVDPRYTLETQPVILAGAHRVSSDTMPLTRGRTSGFWKDFGRVVVTLENKSRPEGKTPGTAIIATNLLPQSVRGR